MRRLSKFWKAGLVIIGLLLAIDIWLINSLSVFGGKIAEIEQLTRRLELENDLAENELARKTSLMAVIKIAEQLGFEKIRKIEVIPKQK